MAVFTVTTLTDENDAGATVAVPIGTGLSLREAIAIANATAGADTIVFDASLSGTIRLTDAAGTLQVTEALTIDGDGRILITGDVAGDDAHVSGSTVITDFAASDTAGKVADNVQIFNATADLALNGLTLTGGVTSDTVLFGGAVLGTTVSVTNTTVTGNGAISGGGGIYASTSVTLTNSTVSGNYGATGGGIAATTATLVNSTVSGNSGSMAGGIWASTAVTLTNSTVSGNSADIEVGGVAAPTIDLTNSIVLGNDASSSEEVSGTVSADGLNIVGTGSDTDGSDGVINAASVGAVFAAVDGATGGGQLADNGGPVQTIALKEDASNPALDAGDDSAPGVPVTDARGFSRDDVSGVANNGASISDLGAFEISHEIVVTTLDDAVDPSDGFISLREAIALANANDGADTITFDASLNGTIRLDGGDGAGGAVGGALSVTDEVTIDGDGRILISGDVNDDDTTVGTTDITDIFATAATELDDNVQIINATADFTLDGFTLTGGATSGDGGAVFSTASVTLTNSTVSGNQAGNNGDGGGIAASTVNLTNSTVSGNSADDDGGGIAATTAATLTNTTVSGNSAVGQGGGTFTLGTATLTNSTVSGNHAGVGGGVAAFTSGSATELVNSIVLGNDASSAGDETAGTVNLIGGNIVGPDVFQDNTDVGDTSAADVFAATVDIGGGVLAGVLADNGGPVQTIALKEDASNPALDAGDDGLAPDTDARGAARDDFAGVANNGADISDLGAFEVTHSFVVTTLDDVVDADDGLMSLREAIDLANGNAGADTITFDASLNGTVRLDGGDGVGGAVGGALSVTDEVTIDGDGRILITGDVNDDDTTVGTSDISNIVATAGTELDDNVRIIDATADLTLDGLTLTGGVAGASGGAIFGTSIVTLTDSTLSGNSAGISGGGVRATTVTLTNSTISGNSAGNVGGGIRAVTANLTNSIVSDNSADNGGGIGADTAYITDTTVSGNGAVFNGGGIYALVAVTLTNSTVSGNSAGTDGGGIYAMIEATLTNSIVLGNDGATNDEVSGTQNRTGGNIVGTDVFQGDTDVGNTTAAQVFAATVDIGGGVLAGVLADNGGPVQTIALKRDLANPALDASNGSAPVTDARGEARLDWPGIANSNGSPADLGAFELQNAAPSATNLTQAKSYLEDAASVALDDIVVSEADVGDTITARLTLANPTGGALTTSGAAIYSAATGVWTITGTVAQVNAALAAVAFVPAANFNGDTTIITHVEDAQGGGPADGTITLDGTAVNDAPAIGSNGGGAIAAVQVAENIKPVTIVVAIDLDGPGAPAYAIAGGADAGLFAIDAATGALAFIAAPDFEAPADADHDNVYEVVVAASDGGLTDTQTILVTVGNIGGVTIKGTKGKDKVNASKTVSGELLPTGEEDLIDGKGRKDKLSGLGGDDTITGGGGRDVLNGGAGDDTLTGGGGRDKYIGGSGNDTFVFDTQVTLRSLFDHLSQAGIKRRVDTIVDYEKDEKIILDSDAFKGLSKGPLDADQFHVGQEAEANTHRIVYDASAGLLIFDRNGSTVAGEAVIARIGKNLGHLGADDFVVI